MRTLGALGVLAVHFISPMKHTRCEYAPAIAGGRLYARNADGDVVCVELP